jgi:signal transduction histidine kinase/ActR/RegA family two-component response regulator
MRAGGIWGVALALLTAYAVAAPAPQSITLVHEVLRDENGDSSPDGLGKVVTVRGTLISKPNHNERKSLVHFQDDTGGLVLVSANPKTFDQLEEGDVVTVRGKVSQYRGMEELQVETIRLVSSGEPVTPREVRAIDLQGERYSGQLVRVVGELVATGGTNGSATFVVRDSRGEIPVFVPWYFRTWHSGELNFKLWKGGKVSVVGIAGQDKAEAPYTAGYGLIPREPDDFFFIPPPPPPLPPPSMVPLYTALGIAVGLGLLALYLWERRRAAEARTHEISRLLREIQRSENEVKKQAAFARFNPNPVLEFFADGMITYSNDAARELAHRLEKDGVEELLPADTRSVVSECLATRRARVGCCVTINERTISWSFFPIHELTSVHAYAQDITDQLSLEGQLRQVQKLESVGQLAAGIAHDFNNMLSVIQGYTGLTLMRSDVPPKVADALNEIAAATERASNLTRQLLAFSRRQALDPRPLDMSQLVANMAKMLRRLLGEDVHLRMECAGGDAWIEGDAGMIEQVIMNLAINARDAMAQGGDLVVSLRCREISVAEAGNRFEAAPGKFICLSVSDSGCGMDDKTLKRIFEPFFTTKEPGKGTGLGLATVHGIVKQHRGWIEVNSSVDKGTTFHIYLPATATPPAMAEGNLIPLPVAGGTETILVVEDDPALRKLARGVLEEYGYAVVDAGTAEEALGAWKQHRERIQLLFTDVVLPNGMSGWKLAEELREDSPDLKVIFATGFDLQCVNRRAADDVETILLRKPYPVQSLVLAVRECLDSAPVPRALNTAGISG